MLMTTVHPETRAGAAALLELMSAIDQSSSSKFADDRDDDETDDPRDYVEIASLVAAALRRHVEAASEQHRQGFIRALSDMILLNVEGCGVGASDWDPLASSEAAFSSPLMAATAIQRAKQLPRASAG